jgi:hypothetical protein
MEITIVVSSISTYWMASRPAFMKYKATLLLTVIGRRLRILYQHLLPAMKTDVTLYPAYWARKSNG